MHTHKIHTTYYTYSYNKKNLKIFQEIVLIFLKPSTMKGRERSTIIPHTITTPLTSKQMKTAQTSSPDEQGCKVLNQNLMPKP